MAARLREHYLKNVVPALTKEFGYKNVMAVPKIEKISVNIGLGEATQNAKLMDGAVNELTQIAGQKPVITKATKSIAAFKLREGMPIGCMVTLRGDRMYEFFDRLVNVALPRVRDFRGVSHEELRRPRQLHAGHEGSVDFPGDRLHQGGQDQGNEYLHHHHGAHRCGRPGAAEAAWVCRSGNSRRRIRYMATTAKIAKDIKLDKRARQRRRRSCSAGTATAAGAADGRAAILRKFKLCRLCFRKLALAGEIPGVIKASW